MAADLHVQFVKAAGASDRAMLADTHEESVAFARQAEAAVGSVQSGLGELGTLIQRLGYREEAELLDRVREALRRVPEGRLRRPRARRREHQPQGAALSFGPVREAADALRGALRRWEAAPAQERAARRRRPRGASWPSARPRILQAPHIAEADDAAMNRLEKEMAARESTAREALATLAGLAGPAPSVGRRRARPPRRFEASSELVALSRRNTHVRSARSLASAEARAHRRLRASLACARGGAGRSAASRRPASRGRAAAAAVGCDGARAGSAELLVEGQVHGEHVDARLAEDAEVAALDAALDDGAHALGRDLPRAARCAGPATAPPRARYRDRGRLPTRSRARRARAGRVRVLLVQPRRLGCDAVAQLLRRRAQVRAARGASRRTRCRPRMGAPGGRPAA